MTEERLKDGFLEALSILHENRETLLNDIRDVKHDLENCTEVNAKITETAQEMEVIAGLIQKAIEGQCRSCAGSGRIQPAVQ